MFRRPALTIIEMILVIALLAILLVPSVMGIGAYRQKQALNASAEILTTVLSRAHIYSREAKEQKQWGVRFKDNRSYEMISGAPGAAVPYFEFELTSPSQFTQGPFEIWFLVDTGEVDHPETITLGVPRGDALQVIVNKAGSAEIKNEK
ncbi:MAG: hypothetical protein AAB909_02590 [Patescibacteria group bacterium]